MKRTPKYVGLDVHQATTVTAVLEESGRVIARSVVPTEATALLDLCRGMRGAVHVALEEGTPARGTSGCPCEGAHLPTVLEPAPAEEFHRKEPGAHIPDAPEEEELADHRDSGIRGAVE